MIVLRTIKEIREYRASLAPSKSVGFVPTMGALHEGHASLLLRSRAENDISILSIFVNPTQFGPNEDLSKYPRTFESDLALAEKHSVDAVFAPLPEEIYPKSYSTFIDEKIISEPLCGKFRPGHFRGVTTIVFRLFQWTRPTRAYFGLKDAQQFYVLKKMASDLDLGIELVGMPTVRESDGLALSSRNRYLSPDAREKAPLIFKKLQQLHLDIRTKDWATAQSQAVIDLERAGFEVQYLDLVNGLPETPPFIAIAAYLGQGEKRTRLIDNIHLDTLGLDTLSARE